MRNVLPATLITRAYPSNVAMEITGLPAWAKSERFDVNATSALSQTTAEDRSAMLRAMLADRFKLVVHIEKREQPVFDLVLARKDRKLGAGLAHIESDCDARAAANRASVEEGNAGTVATARQLPDFKAPPPPCTLRTASASIRDKLGDGLGREGDLMEGETTIEDLATTLRMVTGRFVVNKTGLQGSYRVRMSFDAMASRRGPEAAASPDAPPSVFTAVQEQLGLRLNSSQALRDTLVIDRLERPTEN